MTIRDVARKSGVSVSTVSRVLNDHPDVSKEVRQRVLSAVKELHYVPNSSARDLVRPGSDSVGVIVKGAENPFFMPVIHAIENSVEKTGYSLTTHRISTREDELHAAAQLARSKRLKGLILLGGRFNYTEEEIAALGVPFVCCTYTNSFGTISESKFSSVSIDDRAEAYKAVKMLTDRGHRRIAVMLDSVSDGSIGELRYQGYLDAMRDAGVQAGKELVIESQEFDPKAAYSAARSFLRSGAEFTAIFAIADTFAIAAMKALYDEGIRVPDDCSVIAIDGIEMSLYFPPTLTTLSQPTGAMGAEAVDILMDVIKDGAPHRHVKFETDLREGGTLRSV